MSDRGILADIGKRLAAARKRKGYTQEQLAEMAGLSIKMISAAENGHKAMRPENIIRMSECLGVSTDYLLKGETAALASQIEAASFDRLSERQKQALFNIVNDFLAAFDGRP